MTDFMIIAALTVGTCLVVALLGVGALHLVRGRSLRYQLMIATVVPVAAVAATVLLNVRLMFLSSHDSTVVLVALGIAVALALVGAWWVMRRVARGSAELGAGLQLLVDDSGRTGPNAPEAAAPSAPLPQELSVVLHDLGETRRTLAEARSQQRAAEEARRELVSFMSHDLRTPLAGLRALSEGLEDGVITDVPRAMGHLRATVNRMSHLVDDLFELSRVQGTTEPKTATLVSISEVIFDVASETTATATARQVALDTQVPERDRLSVLGSADDLARALSNLVANAIRHTQPGQTVRLSARRADDGHVAVAVVDGCGGIPEANLARVFDAGWRGTPSRGGDDGGSGLGLAIARGVVESHDGTIAVHNVDGGCRFELMLPEPTALDRHPGADLVKVLLTGGSGFIGTPTHRALVEAGHDVRSYDTSDDPRDDICDLERMRAASQGRDVVVHLAAKVGLGVDLGDIDDYAYVNDVGTAVVLKTAAEAGVQRVVYASSMVVYGEGAYRCPDHGPTRPAQRSRADLEAGRFDPGCPRCGQDLVPELITESAALDPRNVYAATKVHGEHLAAAWSRETSAPVAALRFHNVYGPGMPRDTPYAGVAALFVSQLRRGEAPDVFEDGGQRRNFVHVDDVAAAVTAAVTAPLDAGVTAANIGSPVITTVGEMAAALSDATGGAAPVVSGRFRLGDVRHVTADCRAAEGLLGWQARIPLAEGVRTLLA